MTQRRLAQLILCGLLLLTIWLFISQLANGVYVATQQERATVAARGTAVMTTLEILRTETP